MVAEVLEVQVAQKLAVAMGAKLNLNKILNQTTDLLPIQKLSHQHGNLSDINLSHQF